MAAATFTIEPASRTPYSAVITVDFDGTNTAGVLLYATLLAGILAGSPLHKVLNKYTGANCQELASAFVSTPSDNRRIRIYGIAGGDAGEGTAYTTTSLTWSNASGGLLSGVGAIASAQAMFEIRLTHSASR